MYSIASCFNHSCCPNAIVSFDGFEITVTATQKISKGEQVYISYGPISYRQRTAERQSFLYDHYQVHCKCSACVSPDDARVDISRAFLCRCGGPITYKTASPEVKAVTLSCIACGNTMSDDESYDTVKRSQQATMQFRTARELHDAGELTRAVETAMRALSQREALLYPLHRDLGVRLSTVIALISYGLFRMCMTS